MYSSSFASSFTFVFVLALCFFSSLWMLSFFLFLYIGCIGIGDPAIILGMWITISPSVDGLSWCNASSWQTIHGWGADVKPLVGLLHSVRRWPRILHTYAVRHSLESLLSKRGDWSYCLLLHGRGDHIKLLGEETMLKFAGLLRHVEWVNPIMISRSIYQAHSWPI